MAKAQSLRVKARGTALVPNYELEAAGIRAFVGRKFGPADEPGRFGFAPLDEAVEVPNRAEYVKACTDGDLWAADEPTAKVCGVKFDSTFGAKAEEKAS
jgi:hypothetical protein